MNDHRTPRQQEQMYLGAGQQWAESENQALVASGFESTNEDDDLWSKDGVLFGRNAALQSAGQALHMSSAKDKDVFNEEA